MLLDVADPVANVLKRLLVGNIIYEEDAHSAAVVGGRNRAEAFLSGGVPYLQLDALTVQVDGLDLEVNADRCDEAGGEAVVGESEQQTGLADAGVSYQEQLD